MNGALCHSGHDRSDLEGLGTGVWTSKCAGASQGPTSDGGLGMNGALCHSGHDRSDLEGLGTGAGHHGNEQAPCSLRLKVLL
ncbi:hypothetical protein AC739_02650 [Planococcus glaciei]|nr:hypothetical protein AC739_02650 [Planococcus glaciei]